MAVDLNELLNKPVDDFKPPESLPAGTYFGTIIGRKVDMTTPKDGKEPNPYIRLTIKISHPHESVQDAENIDFTNKTLSKDYYLTEKAGYRFKQLAESLQIPTAQKSSNELMEEMLGHQVIISVSERLNPKDPKGLKFNDIVDMKATD